MLGTGYEHQTHFLHRHNLVNALLHFNKIA